MTVLDISQTCLVALLVIVVNYHSRFLDNLITGLVHVNRPGFLVIEEDALLSIIIRTQPSVILYTRTPVSLSQSLLTWRWRN